MQLLVRGVHIQVTDALREFCEIDLGRALDRVLGREPAVQVEVHLVHTTGENKGGMDKEARVTVHVPGQPALHITETSDEIDRAIAAACDRVERAAKKYVERRHDHSGPSLADFPTEGS